MAKKKAKEPEVKVEEMPKSELVRLVYDWDEELLIDTFEVDPHKEIWVLPEDADALMRLFPERFKKVS